MRLRFLTAGTLLLVACQSVPAPTHTTSGRALAERIDHVIGVPHFARLDDHVYRGGQPTHEGYRNLKKLGVKTVINLRSHHPDKVMVEAAGMESVEIPIRADLAGSEPPTWDQVVRFFEIVRDPERTPVYFHCKMGMDRTGTFAALYRMEKQAWSVDEAIEEMEAFGFHGYYANLMRFVRAYRVQGFCE